MDTVPTPNAILIMLMQLSVVGLRCLRPKILLVHSCNVTLMTLEVLEF